MECPIEVSHSGNLISPLSLITLLTSLTTNDPVSLVFQSEGDQFTLDFERVITLFTPEELGSIGKYTNAFCNFQSNNHPQTRGWLSVCVPQLLDMVLITPLVRLTLEYSDEEFFFRSKSNESCVEQWTAISESHKSTFIVSDEPYINQTLRAYYIVYSHLFSRKRYIEIAMLGDYSLYEKYDKNKTMAKDRMVSLINMVNSLYNALNIEFHVVHLSVAESPDMLPISLNTSDIMFETLKDYLKNNNLGVHYDHATLITGNEIEGDDAAGIALLATMCFPESTHSSVSWFQDYTNLAMMAHTFAHELGHSFGFEHDKNTDFGECECPLESCIEGAYNADVTPRHFSDCSLAYLDLFYSVGADYCMWNKPENNIFTPECGNGIVEDGEDCDCGPAGCITHNCCDTKTCKFRENAECASGSCCDLRTCSVASDTSLLCRANHTSCDLPEYCDGISSECPKDELFEDGEQCPDDPDAICYKGRCGSRTVQCKELWGEEAEPSSEECYEKKDCGMKPEKDASCGALFCTSNIKNPWDQVRGLSFELPVNNDQCKSLLANYQEGYKPSYRYGMTPDGTSCGDGKYCLEEKCVSKIELLDCNLESFYSDECEDEESECEQPEDIGDSIHCTRVGFWMQAGLNDGSWVDSTVSCVDNKLMVVNDEEENISDVVSIRCIRKRMK